MLENAVLFGGWGRQSRIRKMTSTPPPETPEIADAGRRGSLRTARHPAQGTPRPGPCRRPPKWASRTRQSGTGSRAGRGLRPDGCRTSRARTAATQGSDSPRAAGKQGSSVSPATMLAPPPPRFGHLVGEAPLGLSLSDLVQLAGPRPPGDLTSQGPCVRVRAHIPRPAPGPFSLRGRQESLAARPTPGENLPASGQA